MLTVAARPQSLIGPIVLAVVILFGGMQLYYWTDRGIWIDEISQLLNFPLDHLGQAFGPLPEAQQAGPPVFNMLLHTMSELSVKTMRIIMVTITLGIILAALIGAFGRGLIAIAVGLFVLLSHQSFLINASMLKFYAFDMAGFAIFAAWIYAKNPDVPFNLRDVAVLLFGMLIGVSTIVGACVVVAVFLTPRLLRRQISMGEIALGAIVAIIGFGYYLQVSYAVEIQITGFPDTYGREGMDAVSKFFEATNLLFHRRGLVALFVLFGIALIAIVILRCAARAGLIRLILFTFVVTVVFLGLAAAGKYPAVSSRHLVWMMGVYAVFAAAVVHCLLMFKTHGISAVSRGFAVCSLFVLTLLFPGTGLRVIMKWPPLVVEGSGEQVVETLAELPPSDVVNYFGSFRLVPLMIERGAPITQHTYGPDLSTISGSIEAAYFGTDWNNIGEELFSQKIEGMLREDPLGWAKAYVILRARGDFRPLARFALDAAPDDGSTFYISSIHAVWPGSPRRATAGLRDVLDERSCTYSPVAVFETLLSPGYVIEVSCPRND